MEISKTIVEADASLTDRFFAVPFFIALFVCAVPIYFGGYFWRHPNAQRRDLSTLGLVIGLITAVFTALLISGFARMVENWFGTGNAAVHYWSTGSYIVAIWAVAVVAGGVGLALGSVARRSANSHS